MWMALQSIRRIGKASTIPLGRETLSLRDVLEKVRAQRSFGQTSQSTQEKRVFVISRR